PPRPMLGLGFGPTTGLDAETVRLPLPADALLLLYSDGLVERRGVSLQESMDVLARAATSTAAELLSQPGPQVSALADRLLSAVPGAAGDDTTLVLLRRA
uniref:SpoIIE family protein phosphatase n=1 Tax=Kineococcus sp. SYSU DK005 TaxID=3383126 RepID=UPI003D7EF4E7